MEFYSVYRVDKEDVIHEPKYFMSFDNAHAYYLEWEEREPESTILLCYECTED